MLYATSTPTVHSLEPAVVLKSLDAFELRIQEISKTLQRCHGQIESLDYRLKNFPDTDYFVEDDLDDKTVTVTKVANRFNRFVEKIKKLLNAYKKLLSLMKNFSVSAAKTAYIASIPAAVTTAVVAPELTGKFLTVMEKAKAVALSNGNYADKLAVFEQLASTGSLEHISCNENDAACQAAKAIEFNDDPNNYLLKNSLATGMARPTNNPASAAASMAANAVAQSMANAKTAAAAKATTAAKAVIGEKSANADKAESQGKAATEAKISIAGKIVGVGGGKAPSANEKTVANAKNDAAVGKAAAEAKISTDGKIVDVEGAKEATGIAAIIQANPTSATPANGVNGVNGVNDAVAAESVAGITQTSEDSTPITNNGNTGNSNTGGGNSTNTTDPSNNIVIITNTETDKATAIQNGSNNYIRIDQPGGSTANVTQEGSRNTATINQ